MGNNSVRAPGPAVTIEYLQVVRGHTTVLPDLSMTIPRGSIVGLLGPIGSDKTTLMRSIVGVQMVKAGSVEVLGLPAGSPALRRKVAYATQQASVYNDLTVRQNLRYFQRVIGAPASDVERVITRTEMSDAADRLVGSLSGGQKSRVSLATALLGAPELLVLDEPTAGLDPLVRRELWNLLRTLADEGATLLVSSHVMDEAKRCDSLVLMRNGALVAADTVPNLLAVTGADDAEEAFVRLIDHQRGQTR